MGVVRLLTISSIVITATSAEAFETRETNTGEHARWADGTVELELAMGHGSDALVRAAASWNDAMPAGASVSVKQVSESRKAVPRDGRNVVVWDSDWDDDFDPHALAITRVTFLAEGPLLDADIVFNAERYTWHMVDDAECAGAYDLQSVATHEIGHALGLMHTKTMKSSVMYPTIGSCVEKRTLDPDDVAGMHYLYEELPPLAGCSASTDRAGWLAVGLVLLGIALSRRRLRAMATSCCVVAIGGQATATTFEQVPVEQLSATSAMVVRGVVETRVAHRLGERVYTDATVRVTECWRGACRTLERVVVRQRGGTVDGLTTHVEGTPQLYPGAEVVVVLRKRSDATYAPLGMVQAVFRFDGTGFVRDLRRTNLLDRRGQLRLGGRETWTEAALRRAVTTSEAAGSARRPPG